MRELPFGLVAPTSSGILELRLTKLILFVLCYALYAILITPRWFAFSAYVIAVLYRRRTTRRQEADWSGLWLSVQLSPVRVIVRYVSFVLRRVRVHSRASPCSFFRRTRAIHRKLCTTILTVNCSGSEQCTWILQTAAAAAAAAAAVAAAAAAAATMTTIIQGVCVIRNTAATTTASF